MKVGIIGYGFLAESLAKKLYSLNILDFVVIKNNLKLNKAKSIYKKVNIFKDINSIETSANLIFILTQDSEILNIAKKLAKLNLEFQKMIFVHSSGILKSEILRDLREKGAIIASAHPYQTFWSRDEDSFKDVPWLIEASDNQNLDSLINLIKLLNGNVFLANDEQIKNKIGYHASAVIISNYMNVLFELSKEMAELSGFSPSNILPVIAKQTIENNIKNLSNNSTIPLTGPIARGDLITIEKHLSFFGNNEKIIKKYIYLSLAANELAYEKSIINKEIYEKIEKLLISKLPK